MNSVRRLRPIILVQAATLLGLCHGMAVSSRTTAGGTGFGASKTAWKVHVTDDSQATQQLLRVLASFPGADVSNVEVGFSPAEGNRRGIFAVKHVNKGKIICRVPSDCALAVTAPPSAGNASAATLNPAQVGANFFNMYYNNPGAREQWSWYLDALPDLSSFTLESTPDCWSPEDIDLLEFPRAVREALQRKEQVEQVSAAMGIDLQALQYATWLVSSRGFSIALSSDGATANTEEEVLRDERGQVLLPVAKEEDKATIRVLVPLLDMANCNMANANCRWTILDPEKDDAWFALEATRPIAPGKEVTLAYGSGGAPYSSVELLNNYGFVPKVENPIDGLMLRKGGDDVLATPSDWSTSLEEDVRMMEMLGPGDHTLRKALALRIRLKGAYGTDV